MGRPCHVMFSLSVWCKHSRKFNIQAPKLHFGVSSHIITIACFHHGFDKQNLPGLIFNDDGLIEQNWKSIGQPSI